MPLQAGIVGLPNVGKSTLFNALTAAGAEAANYPFATIEPNVGVVPVPDPRLEIISQHISSERIVPAVVEIVDIAGLVRGASEGEGLGNQFLGHIRSVDAVLQVVRCFEDPDVTHVDGAVDPLRDIETVTLELILADLQLAERRLDRFSRMTKTGDKAAAFHRDTAQKMVEVLAEGSPARSARWSPEELASLADAQLITLKPMLYVCNVDERHVGGNDLVEMVRHHSSKEDAGVVVISAKVEADIAELPESERDEFLADLGLDEPGLARLAHETYRLLGLETFFTAGPKQIRAWTIRKGTTALKAAGVIHGDFERGFIRAEVYTIDDLVELGSEAAIKRHGRMRVEGKQYVVQDGDVVHFLFNV